MGIFFTIFLCPMRSYWDLPERSLGRGLARQLLWPSPTADIPWIAWLWWPEYLCSQVQGGCQETNQQILISQGSSQGWSVQRETPMSQSSAERDLFACFKSSCLSVPLPISQILDANWDPSLWKTDKSWHILNYGSHWGQSRLLGPSQSFRRQQELDKVQ